MDPDFDENIALEVIERGSAVHCVSTYEGDILIMGSDGVFDNLFLDEIVEICNSFMPPPRLKYFEPLHPSVLSDMAQYIVEAAHAKTKPAKNGSMPETPIGRGGKMDDTSVVVAEVVEYTEAHDSMWHQARRQRKWDNITGFKGSSLGPCRPFGWSCTGADSDYEYEDGSGGSIQKKRADDYDEDDEEERRCSLM